MNRVLWIILFSILLSCGDKPTPKASPSLNNQQTAPLNTPFPRAIAMLNQPAFPEFTFDSLQHGYDSFQLRVMSIGGFYNRTNLYIIKKNRNGWTGQHIDLEMEEKYANGDSTHAYLSGPWP
ncbi:MAG: hypothetical protein EOP48_30435, partial [Sphingobacteriales bacterium]